MKLDELDKLIRDKTKRWEKRVKDRDLFEVVDEVFDNFTVMNIIELHRKGVLGKINGVVSAGKESKVYLGVDKLGKRLAVKIYLVSSAEFKKSIHKYIAGDPRFEGLKARDMRSLIVAWAQKEYRNLIKMCEAGVKVPQPVSCVNNVLVMEFLGEDRHRYPLLVEVFRDLTEEELNEIYRLVVEELEKIVCRAGLVHGDFSEYNVVVKPGPDIAVIDVSQAVDVGHPNALDFLARDVENIYRFFTKDAKIEPSTRKEDIISRLTVCLEKKRGT
ncbi:MAG: serine protein kinase RIO [Desulfurococcaceae archaeon]